jgi:hypothetical protein
MPETTFEKPSPNDKETRRARNLRISEYLGASSDDIVDVFLETLATGGTRWKIAFRDGRVDHVDTN